MLWASLLFILYGLAGMLLGGHCLHRVVMLCRLWRTAPKVATSHAPDWPEVTVQLPVYNEGELTWRLIEAVLALDYPREKLLLQVLDDSTDGTAPETARRVAELRAAGHPIVHRHRAIRTGYKAGALLEGMPHARGDLLAIFDADFVPAPDYLRKVVPVFQDPAIGMVQGRWGHLNGAQNFLTELQQLFIDGHFLIEQAGRSRHGYWFNFNGSAGVWRRACIEQAGHWQADTLTEDLDLSYRAQMRGWKFAYLDGAVVPGELPADMLAYKSQQHRWAKGSMQTARKLLGAVWQAASGWKRKGEAFAHLAANSIHLGVIALALLNLPVFYLVTTGNFQFPPAIPLLFSAMLVVSFGFMAAAILMSRVETMRRLLLLPVYAAVSLGFSLHNGLAWLEGLSGRTGEFVRTPKGPATRASESRLTAKQRWILAGELGLMLAYFGALIVALQQGAWEWVPTHLLHLIGFGYVGLNTLRLGLGRPPEKVPVVIPPFGRNDAVKPRRQREAAGALSRGLPAMTPPHSERAVSVKSA